MNSFLQVLNDVQLNEDTQIEFAIRHMNDTIRYEHSIKDELDIDLNDIRPPLTSDQYRNPFGIKFESKILKVPLKISLG